MKKNDIILIGVILLLGIGVIVFMNIVKTEGSKVVVTINGEFYDDFSLEEDTSFTVKKENGQWNTFEVKNGIVDMIDASCPDKLCVDHSSIHYNHETIVCLPNQVVLEIQSNEDSDIDIIAQ
jgi:hypothetical protein